MEKYWRCNFCCSPGHGTASEALDPGDQFAASASASASAAAKPQVAEREMIERQRPRPRPPSKEQALHCPRCKSTNTKFCYYNNYSLTQPRYFCKTCRRYWTDGGSLRNVPVGGGSRKNKNKTVAASAAAAAADTTTPSSKAQKLFPESNTIWQESSSNSYNLSAMDMLKSSTAVPDYTGAGFEGFMQEFIRPPAISFPLDSAAGSSKLMFPLEEQNKGQGGGGDPASGYWNGMLMGEEAHGRERIDRLTLIAHSSFSSTSILHRPELNFALASFKRLSD